MNAIDKVRDEMAKDKSWQIGYLGEGLTALLGIHPEYAANIAAEGKTLKGCLEAIKNSAKGGVSDPATSTKSICAYYGIKVKDANRLAMEVHMAMLGGAVPQTPAEDAREKRKGGGNPEDCRFCPEGETGFDKSEIWQNHRKREKEMPGTGDDFDLDALLGVL